MLNKILIWILSNIIISFHYNLYLSLFINHLAAKLFNWNFHSVEVVFCWRDPQLQVVENYFTKLMLKNKNK